MRELRLGSLATVAFGTEKEPKLVAEEARDGRRGGFDMTVVATPRAGEVCVSLKGELEISTVPIARDRLADLAHKGSGVVLDLRGLSFIDSTGLGLVLSLAADSTREGWSLSLIPGSTVVQRVFQMTGTEQRLPFRGLPQNRDP
jgi:anti-sigma B factor antagonist